MKSLNRIARTAAAALTLVVGGIALAPAASATTYQRCSSVDGGYFCGSHTTKVGAEYWRASFLNQSTTTKTLRFALVCTNQWDETYADYDAGSFKALPGRAYSYVWDTSWKSNGQSCYFRLYDLGTRETYDVRVA
ncbi:hypothetical protein [Kitasatospora indigofera]|uniref:hypothetical protein n=1 Tax=Kitasatospora indigofera TaxID=67307 RepID=UPI0033A29501